MFESDFPPFLANANSQMAHPKVKLLAKVLQTYDLAETVSIVAGMFTVPRFQANSVRLEMLCQLAVGACEGKTKPTWKHLNTWLNRQLGVFEISSMEDPPEDPFVVNVLTPEGDFRVLGGLWEGGDSATTLLIQAIASRGGPMQLVWLQPAIALLRLSDAVAARSGLVRWQTELSVPKSSIHIVPATPLTEWRKRITFTFDELIEYAIKPEDLTPFLCELDVRGQLLEGSNQESALHRTPVLSLDGRYILALPNAVTYAVRRYLLSCAARAKQLGTLNGALMMCAQERVGSFSMHGSRHGMSRVELPQEIRGVRGLCSSMVVRVGRKRFLHFLLVSDDLRQMDASGFLQPSVLPEHMSDAVAAHVKQVREHVEAREEVDSGHTFFIAGLLGQGFIERRPPESSKWTFMPARLNDLELLFRDPEDPADHVILLLNQERELAAKGLEIPFANGLLNLYAFWLKQGFHLRIEDAAHNRHVFLQIGTDFVAGYRKTRLAAVDQHCTQLPSGRFTVVQRGNAESIYRSLRDVPAYVSLDLLRQAVLGFCMNVGRSRLWVVAESPSDSSANGAVFELWQALQLLAHRAVESGSIPPDFRGSVVQVILEFKELKSQEAAIREKSTDTELHISVDDTGTSAVIRAEPGFLRRFEGAENAGEQYLLTEFLRSLSLLSSDGPNSGRDFSAEALQVLGGTGARILHTLRYWADIDHLLASDQRRVYRRPDEHIESTMRSAFVWMKPPAKTIDLDAPHSTDTLNACVSSQAALLQQSLRRFGRVSLIPELLHCHETLLRDEQRWRTTARAVRSLYGIDDGTRAAQESAQERTQLKIVLRTLVEAATCECVDVDGEEPDGYRVDELVGRMATINNIGRDSDAVYFGLASKGIRLYPNGAYKLDANLFGQLAEPFMLETFEEGYAAASDAYGDWVRTEAPSSESAGVSVFDSDAFINAWAAEYGVSFSAFREIAGELQDLAVKRGAIVLEASIAEIARARADAGITEDDVRAFVGAFGLPRRSTWLPMPPEAAPKDINPWRFERRLSLSLRPLVILDAAGERFLYGVGTMRESLGYVLDSIRNATFDKDVFRSKEMRAWLGARVYQLGSRFTERVASALRASGWTAVTEVKLTQLGAPKNPNLGDIDVLAWRSDGSTLVIECKRLKASRTIAEIAQSCERFRGNVGDRLHKHLRRVAWIESNLDKLARFAKIPAAAIHLQSPLVVSRPVPFKYLQGLPILPSEVVRFDALLAYVNS